MNILQKIRTKAQQAIQGVGNFIDRDKSMDGVQLAQGGLGNRVSSFVGDARQKAKDRNQEIVGNIANTQVGGHRLADQLRAYPQAFAQNLPFTPERQENFNRNVGDIFGEKSIPTTIAQGANNWVGAPLAQVPYHLREVFAPDKTKMERVSSGANAAFGLLPGIDDAIFAGYNSLKTGAGQRDVSGLQEGLAGNAYTGLGDAVTGGKEGLTTDLLNVAELPLILFGGLKAKGGLKSVDDAAQNLKNMDMGKTTAKVVEGATDAFKKTDTIVKEVVENTGQVPLEKLFKSKAKDAKAAREAIKAEVGQTSFNPGNKVTNFMRDFFLDTSADLKRTFGGMYDTQIEPVIKRHTERIANAVDWKNKYRTALESIDIKPGTPEDTLLRQFGKKDGAAKVIETVGEERAAQLKQTYDSLRGMYDEILDTVNANRKAKGLNEIPKKDNFLSQIGSKEKGIFDFTLEGGVDTTDATSKAIFKKQSGKNENLGAIESMTQYLEYAARAGFTDLTGAEMGMLKKVFKKAGVPDEAVGKLSRLEENILGTKGKGNLEKTIEGVTGQMRQAAVVGKVGTLVNQFLSAPQGFMAAGAKNFVQGQFVQEAKQAAKSSQFLKATGDKIPRSLRTGNAYTKAVGFTGDMLQGAQQTTNKAIWQGFYQQAKNMGQSAEEAVEFADQLTPKIVGDRRLGMSPAAYNTLVGKIFGAFTLEPAAASTRLFSQAMKATKDKKAASEVVGTVIGWHFLNGLYERWGAGYRPYPDIPEAVMDSIEYATGSDEKEQSSLKAVARLFSESLQFAPVVNNVFNTIYSAGEMADIFPESREVFGQDDNTWMNAGSLYNPLGNATRRITGAPIVDVPVNVASNFLPFFDQAAKTTQAGITLAKGAAESRAGGITFEAPGNPIDAVRSLMFGQYSTPEAQEYFDSDFNRPLSEQESAVYKSLPADARSSFLETKRKSKQNTSRLKSEGGGSIMDIFGGGKKEPTYSGITPTTKEEKQALTEYVNTSLTGGAIPDDRDIKNGLFNGYTATSESIEERTKVYSELNKIMQDEYLTDEQKQAVIKASGADPKNAEYFQLASKDQDVRLQEMLPIIDNMDNAQMIEYLSQGRRAIGGKQLVSNGMIDYLYEMDYLSENEKKALKAIKYDEIGDKFYLSKSYKGGGGSISYKKALEMFHVDLPKFSKMRSVENLLAQYSRGAQQTGSQGETLLSDILYKAPTKKSTNQNLWF